MSTHAYRVTADSINIHAGVLVLNTDQAEPRKHRLKQLGANRYEVSDPPVSFKRGEVFVFDGELPKGLVQVVTEVIPDTGYVKPAAPRKAKP